MLQNPCMLQDPCMYNQNKSEISQNHQILVKSLRTRNVTTLVQSVTLMTKRCPCLVHDESMCIQF